MGSQSRIQEVLTSRRLLLTFVLGFSSGMPLSATGGTLQAWMKRSGVDVKSIGMLSLIGIPYTFKFLWAPLIDRYVPPFLGRRRGWMLITQILLFIGLALFALTDPAVNPLVPAMLAVCVAFFSASQDIVLDAHRRDSLADNELGLGSSLFVCGYRVGMLVSGGLALILVSTLTWQGVYLFLALTMAVGIAATFLAEEPEGSARAPVTLEEAVVIPWRDLIQRSSIVTILLFIVLYKLGESMASTMTTAFILDIGFTEAELGVIVKSFGLIATLAGGLAGGILMVRLGIRRSLLWFGILQGGALVGFSLLAKTGHNPTLLAIVIASENLSSGMATSAYVAFLASLCNRSYSASQYALLSSLTRMAGVYGGAPTGYLVASVGWFWFFILCAIIAVPGLILLRWVPIGEQEPK